MTDRAILFSGPMVRAILDGRKTVTRRVVKKEPTPGMCERCWRDAYDGGHYGGCGSNPWVWRIAFKKEE